MGRYSPGGKLGLHSADRAATPAAPAVNDVRRT